MFIFGNGSSCREILMTWMCNMVIFSEKSLDSDAFYEYTYLLSFADALSL